MRTKRLLAMLLAVIMMFPTMFGNSAAALNVHAEENSAYEEYAYLDYNDDQLLPYEERWLGTELFYYIRDEEHPDGEEFYFPIFRIEISQQYVWGEDGERIPADEEIFFLDGNSEEGWNFRAEDYGSADLKLYYEDEDGKLKNWDFSMYSVNEIYYLEWDFLNGTQFYLKNFEAPVYASLRKNYRNDENGENIYNEYIDNFTLKFSDDSMSQFDSECLTANVSEDGKAVEIRTKDNEGNAWMDFRAYIQENGEEREVTGKGFHILVRDRFVNILPYALENPAMGETLDLEEAALYYYQGDDFDGVDISEDETIRMYVSYYDDHVFSPEGDLSSGQIPGFTRISNDGGAICIVAEENVAAEGEEPEWVYVTERWYYFDWLDYYVWFDNLQHGGHGYVYSTQKQIFTVNKDNLGDKDGYRLVFEVGKNVNDEFVAFENDESLFEEVTENGEVIGIEVNGEALFERKDELREGGWFEISVSVFVGETCVARDWRGVELREEWVDYHYNEWGFVMLPHWGHGIGKNLGYNLNNEENPDGCYEEIEYTDISVEIIDGRANALEVQEWDDGQGWDLIANDYGHAVVTLYHPSVTNPSETLEHSFDVWIGQDVWELRSYLGNGTSDIVPGETKDVTLEIQRECFNDEEGHFRGETDQVAYRWGYCEGNREDLLQITAEEQVLHITANEDAEEWADTHIWVRAYMTDEDGNILQDEQGNDLEVAYTDFRISIRNEYLTVYPLRKVSPLELGETIELKPVLMLVTKEGTNPVEGQYAFRYEWDPNCIRVRTLDGKALTMQEDGRSEYITEGVKLTKLETWNTGIQIFAYMMNENGDYEEVFGNSFELGEASYDAFFEKDRGSHEGFTYLFADETAYSVSFNVDSMRKEDGALKDHITIDWTVGERNSEGDIIREMTEGVEYTLNEEKTVITLNGEKLTENGFKDELSMQVVVKSNGIKTTEHPHELTFFVHDEMIQLEDDGNSETLAIPSWGWYYENGCMNAYVANSTYPKGEEIVFEILNIETRAMDGGDGEVFEIFHDSQGNWRVQPRREGEAELIYTLYHDSYGEIEVVRTKYALQELYYMDLLSGTHTWCMLSEAELEMVINIYQYSVTGDDSYAVDLVSPERYSLRYDYNSDLITIDEDGKVFSHDWYGSTGVYAEAEIQMLDAENVYITGGDTEIHVVRGYGQFLAEPLYMEPDEVINVEDLPIYWVEFSEDNREGEYYPVEEFYLHESPYMEVSEDGRTLRLREAISDDELPVSFRMSYSGTYQDAEDWWDYLDVIICRHSMTEWFVDQEPTNIKDGLEIRWCVHCGMVESRIMESLQLAVMDVFSDVYKDWYTSYVQYVFDHELMTGMKGTNQFAPNANITKAQVAQVLYNMEGQPEVSDRSVFGELTDVYKSEWYANAVAWAYSTGVVTGDLNQKKFFPNADVTREQLALMMYRYAKYKNYNVRQTSNFEGLVGADRIANWSKDGVTWAVGAGLISGVEKNGVKDIAPQGNATRAQVAAILMRFCQEYEK